MTQAELAETLANLKKAVSKGEERREQLDFEIMTETSEIFRIQIASFIERNPAVRAVRWMQYTPYFNDGEECLFSVHTPQLLLNEEFLKENIDKADDYVLAQDDDELWYDDGHQYYLDKTLPAVKTLLGHYQLLLMLFQNKDLLSSAFGDHKKITFAANSASILHYTDHN